MFHKGKQIPEIQLFFLGAILLLNALLIVNPIYYQLKKYYYQGGVSVYLSDCQLILQNYHWGFSDYWEQYNSLTASNGTIRVSLICIMCQSAFHHCIKITDKINIKEESLVCLLFVLFFTSSVYNQLAPAGRVLTQHM